MSSFVRQGSETISQDQRGLVAKRYKTITRAINSEFWNSISDTQHSLYVGSYGRGTAIDTSDLDVLVQLPKAEYDRYDSMRGNGQSRLLQAVKNAILEVYPRTNVHADGQVVVLDFSDGMKFEVLPAFMKEDWYGNPLNEYTYPDTNMGGNWRSTNPKAEQEAMKNRNVSSNGLLFDTCKHIRRVRDDYYRSYHLSGIVIDSFVYDAIKDWHWCVNGEASTQPAGTYEGKLLSHLNQIQPYDYMPFRLYAPGSKQLVDGDNSIVCLRKVLNYMANLA